MNPKIMVRIHAREPFEHQPEQVMSVITIVRKNGQCAIAADSLTVSGSVKTLRQFQRNESKIIPLEKSYLGSVGYSAHGQVLESLVERHGEIFDLNGRDRIFASLFKIHEVLKKEYLLQTSEPDSDQPYESSQLTFCVANASGIYVVESYREVTEYEQFWAIGSGRAFALGAMQAVYDEPEYDAEVVALERARALGAESIHPWVGLATPSLVEAAHAEGFGVHVFTVDRVEDSH